MDTNTLVDALIEDGARLLDGLAARGVPVQYAYWGQLVDEDRWTLTIASPIVDEHGATAGYRTVYGVLRAIECSALTDSDIRLVRSTEPKAVVLGAYPRVVPQTLISQSVYGPDGPEVVRYIYPPADRSAAHTGLTAEHKQLLIDLYSQTPLSVDDLPYSDEMTRLHKAFIDQTGASLTIREVYKALKNLGRQGFLGGKRQANSVSALASPASPA